jgi:hypothetical protein
VDQVGLTECREISRELGSCDHLKQGTVGRESPLQAEDGVYRIRLDRSGMG